MDGYFHKTASGLIPATEDTKEWYDKQKIGGMVKGKFAKVNNPAFHRKLFKLLNVGFEYWQNLRYGRR